jgi:hypothetical protein
MFRPFSFLKKINSASGLTAVAVAVILTYAAGFLTYAAYRLHVC